jgi:hypothetical protein
MRTRRWFHSRVLDIHMPTTSLIEIARHKRDFPFDDSHFVDRQLNPVRRNSLDGQMYEAIYNEAVIQHMETLDLLEKAIFEEYDKEKRDEYLFSVMKRTGRTGRYIPSTTKPINPEEGD